MINIYDRDRPLIVDPVAATASTVPIIQWRQQTPADTVRIVQQRSFNELERDKRHRLGKPLSQRTSNGGSHT
jgi:hypothetical protein